MLERPNAEAEVVEGTPVPLGVALGQIVVDGDQVGALALQGVEIEGKGSHQGLALARLHLGDLALVENDAAQELHVEGSLADGAADGLPGDGEGLDQKVVQRLAVVQAAAELVGLGPQLVVAEGLDSRARGR